MGTRCLTRVFDGDREVCCIYRHWDGYPSGHGAYLAAMLKGKRLVNGWSSAATLPECDRLNGAGRVAAFIISTMQADGHNPDIMPTGTKDVGEEYEYRVMCPELEWDANKPDGVPIKVAAFDGYGKRVSIPR